MASSRSRIFRERIWWAQFSSVTPSIPTNYDGGVTWYRTYTVAILFPGSPVVESEKWKCKLLSHVWLCDPMGCSLPGFSVHGSLQTRILEWVAIPLSRDLPNPGIEPRSPALQADSLPSEPLGKPWISKAGATSSILGSGTKAPHAAQCIKKKFF